MILLTFLESFASMMVQRGVYFFCRHRLGFSDVENLWLALVFGATYVVGALSSHPLAVRLREKPLLIGTLAAQLVLHVLLGIWASPGAVFVSVGLLGWLNGCKWPLVESYASAGHDPRHTAHAVGRFNLSWAMAGPVALVAAGPLIAFRANALFLAGAAVNVVALGLVCLLPTHPPYLPLDHPDRPGERQILRMRALLVSSRWLMLLSYTLMRILDPLLPRVMADLGVSVRWATGLVGLMDLARLATFAALQWYHGWHGRLSPLVLGLVCLPGGFGLMVFAPDLAAVVGLNAGVVSLVLGEVAFGAAAGITYYAALYYAMVVRNAAVDAGGGHEAMIGSGFVLGPTAWLAGMALTPVVHSQVLGTLAGLSPVLLLCGAGAAWAVYRARGVMFGRPAGGQSEPPREA